MIEGIRGRTVYLCAPMSGLPDHNRDALNAAETLCKESGARRVYNPAALVGSGHSDQECMARDLEVLLDLRRTSNLVMLQLPGWQRSSGCLTEWMIATRCGIECMEVDEVG